MKFDTKQIGKSVVIPLDVNNFDTQISSEFKAEILRISKEKFKKLVLDFNGVQYIDSSGIGALLFTNRQGKEKKFSICIAGINNTVLKMLRISSIDQFFEFSNSVDEAL